MYVTSDAVSMSLNGYVYSCVQVCECMGMVSMCEYVSIMHKYVECIHTHNIVTRF